jgi:DNA invertase Pin-like site-specific DNA recombinase
VYSDNGVSGAKGRNQRPGLDVMLKDASRGRFDVVLAWALDRLGRSLIDLLETLGELEAAAVALVLHQQAIDTTTPAGRMFFQVTGAFAEFERGMIRSRVMAGLERARARGVQLGRRKTSSKVEAAIRARLAKGEGIKKVAKAVGVGNGTVSRIKAETEAGTHQALLGAPNQLVVFRSAPKMVVPGRIAVARMQTFGQV